MKKLLVFVLLLFGAAASAQQIDIGPLPKARPFGDVDFFLHRDTVTISFTGDVMQHGAQINSALKQGGGKHYNYVNAFKYTAPLFRQADYMVANMEFTVGTKPYTGYPCFSAPKEIASAAKKSGIDLFLMANNHICDKGATGFKNTIAAYSELEMPTLGAYRNKAQADTSSVILVELKGMKFAMFNYTYDTNGLPVPEPYYVNLQDSTEIKKNIKRAKDLGADIIIALPHWGIEYVLEPVAEQKQYAKMMFREGVNAIHLCETASGTYGKRQCGEDCFLFHGQLHFQYDQKRMDLHRNAYNPLVYKRQGNRQGQDADASVEIPMVLQAGTVHRRLQRGSDRRIPLFRGFPPRRQNT